MLVKLVLLYWPSSGIFEKGSDNRSEWNGICGEYEIENQRGQRNLNKLIGIPRVIAWLIASAARLEYHSGWTVIKLVLKERQSYVSYTWPSLRERNHGGRLRHGSENWQGLALKRVILARNSSMQVYLFAPSSPWGTRRRIDCRPRQGILLTLTRHLLQGTWSPRCPYHVHEYRQLVSWKHRLCEKESRKDSSQKGLILILTHSTAKWTAEAWWLELNQIRGQSSTPRIHRQNRVICYEVAV
jgi:hypothetical protein